MGLPKFVLFALLALALLSYPIVAGVAGAAQENDYRIVPDQRLGPHELQKPLQLSRLGTQTMRWELTGGRSPYGDAAWFAGAGIVAYTCRSDGLPLAIIASRHAGAPQESQAEAARYRTAEGIGVGTDAGDLPGLLGWTVGMTDEFTRRFGADDEPLVLYAYPGLHVYVSQKDRKVVALGPAVPLFRWMQCGLDLALLQALTGAADRPALNITRPVALTSCEAAEFRRLLLASADARRLYEPIHTIAEEALDDPPYPLPRLFLQDLIPTDPRAQLSARFYKDARRTEALGYAYAATGDPRFADRAGVYLDAWASIHQPDGLPINETEISQLIRGYSLVVAAIPPAVRARIESWMGRMATLQIERQPEWEARNSPNHFSHRLKIVGFIGYALDNPGFVRYGEEGYRKQIAVNLRPDGSSFDFHHRDALHYHVYNLMPLLELAIVANKHGVNLFGYRAPTGASLERSIAFLLPYVRGEKVHLEFVRSPVLLDRQRGETGIPGFQVGAPWDPRRGAYLLEMAGYFNPAFANEPIRGQVRRTFRTILNGLRAACGAR